MLFNSLLVAAFASYASAGLIIVTDTTILTSFTDAAEQSKVVNNLESALSTYLTHVSAAPEFSSYRAGLSEYVATRTDAPASLILDDDVVSTITSIPAWYSAMPSELKQYGESVLSEQNKIAASVISQGAAARPTDAAKYGPAGMMAAAAVAGAAILL